MPMRRLSNTGDAAHAGLSLRRTETQPDMRVGFLVFSMRMNSPGFIASHPLLLSLYCHVDVLHGALARRTRHGRAAVRLSRALISLHVLADARGVV
jgi:hypothetical protein